MITPLDYRVPDASSESLAFLAHAGEPMTLQRATKGEHFYFNSHPDYFAPKTKYGFGCESGYHDDDDGSFTIPFAVILDRPSRRFSP